MSESQTGTNVLSYEQARKVYDRIGSFQDSQAFYEDRATSRVIEYGRFDTATSVFEFGCGTGRFAEKLLRESLPVQASYTGVDISATMVNLAIKRRAGYDSRAQFKQTEGGPPTGEPSESYDRFVSNYVFDLLSHDDIRAVLNEAYRILLPGGLICLAGISTGVGVFSRLIARTWGWIHAVRPTLVGGCRPIEIRPFLDDARWQVLHHERIVSWGVTSEVLVARPI